MAETIFNIESNGIGIGQQQSSITTGAGNMATKTANINYNTYFYDDVKLPGKCEQYYSTWTEWTGNNGTTVQFSKIASHIYMNVTKLVAATDTNSGLLGTVPEEYRPSKGLRFYARGTYSGSNGCIAKYFLDTTGEFKLFSVANSAGSTLNQPTAQVTSESFQVDYWGN